MIACLRSAGPQEHSVDRVRRRLCPDIAKGEIQITCAGLPGNCCQHFLDQGLGDSHARTIGASMRKRNWVDAEDGKISSANLGPINTIISTATRAYARAATWGTP